MTLPTIALFTGDPAGIGPELVSKLLAGTEWRSIAQVVLIGQQGALLPPADVRWHDWPGRRAAPFQPAHAGADNGRFMLDALTEGLGLVQSGQAQALCFAPLNKSALRQGGMHQEDELRWFADMLAYRGTCGELNVLDRLWTSRVTSHVALRDVSGLLTSQRSCLPSA